MNMTQTDLPMQANVLIADDHPLFRAAMRQALAGITGESVVEASTFSEARDALIQDMKLHDMYVDNLENQGLVRLIQHLGIDAMQRAEILSQASIQEMQQALLERIEMTRRLIQQSPQDGSSFFVN